MKFLRSLLILSLFMARAALAAGTPPPKPNIIFILADDLGYGEVGCFGQKTIRTPHLDRMAREGMRFTQFYAGATVCAPSRSVLMTGRHGGHTRVRGNGTADAGTLRDGDVTVAEVLKKAGYATALIGKWGLGEANSEGAPNKQGFDYFFGYLNQVHAHNYWPEFLLKNGESFPLRNVAGQPDLAKKKAMGKNAGAAGAGVAMEKRDYAPDLLMADALRWIEEQKAAPFFLYLAGTLPHANNEAMRATGNGNEVPELGEYAGQPWPEPDRAHAAMVTRLDADVGKILALLQKLGLDEKTLIIFTSDNGPHREGGHGLERFQPSGPLRGLKRDLYEGGIRVPMIARWPGQVPANAENGTALYFGDFMATAAQLAGAEPPPEPNPDSLSFVPALLGEAEKQEKHKFLYWEFHESGFNQAALMDGRWKAVRKLRRDAPVEIYDLAADPGEKQNLAATEPDILLKLEINLRHARTELAEWPIRDAPELPAASNTATPQK